MAFDVNHLPAYLDGCWEYTRQLDNSFHCKLGETVSDCRHVTGVTYTECGVRVHQDNTAGRPVEGVVCVVRVH